MITSGDLAGQLGELTVLVTGLLALVVGLELVYFGLRRKASLRNRSSAKSHYETL